MPVLRFDELAASRSGDKDSRERKYLLFSEGMSDENVFDWLNDPNATLSNGQTFGTGYPVAQVFDDRPITNISYDLLRDCDPEIYEVTVTWEWPDEQDLDEPDSDTKQFVRTFSMELGVGTEHIDFSRATATTYNPTSGTAVNYDRKIGVSIDADGQTEIGGFDKQVPTLNFSVSVQVPAGVLTDNVRHEISKLVGKINETAFFNYPIGSVMFTGANLSMTNTVEVGTTDATFDNQTQTQIEFRFEYRQPLENFTVPGLTGTIEREGWQLFWIASRETVESGKPVVKITGGYVEDIYEKAELNRLFRSDGVWA